MESIRKLARLGSFVTQESEKHVIQATWSSLNTTYTTSPACFFRRRDYSSIIFNVIEVTACELWRLHSQKRNKEDILARPPKQISYQKSISLMMVSWFVLVSCTKLVKHFDKQNATSHLLLPMWSYLFSAICRYISLSCFTTAFLSCSIHGSNFKFFQQGTKLL